MKRAAAALLCLALAGCGPHAPRRTITTLEAPGAVDWSAAAPIDIVLSDFDISPETILLKAGQPWRLRFINRGSGTHDFSAPSFFRTVAPASDAFGSIEIPDPIVLARGEERELTIVPLQSGTYPAECTEFLHATLGMTANVVVE